MICALDHIVINAIDTDVMISFYTDVLQLKAERIEEFRSGSVPFPSVRLNPDTIIDLFPKKMWQKTAHTGPGRVNMNHLCIATSKREWDALSARLKVKGVALKEGPVQRWGAHGAGISIYFLDPEGNLIEARYYESIAKNKDPILVS
jgi:catechol 2,3-dioxygenase-like lactoylglutathione lyase family enzyme